MFALKMFLMILSVTALFASFDGQREGVQRLFLVDGVDIF